MTKKQLQNYFQQLGFSTEYSGHTKTLYVNRNLEQVGEEHKSFDTLGIIIAFNL